jgi:hypothetical protein
MSLAKESSRCPYCREPIAVGAVRCKHCHADLAGSGSKRKSPLDGLNTFRTGFLSGILFCLVITLLIYFQFFAGD